MKRISEKEISGLIRKLQANTVSSHIQPDHLKIRLDTIREKVKNFSFERVERAVEWLLDQPNAMFPTPGEVLEAIEATRPSPRFKGSYNCTMCYDEGVVAGPFLVTWDKGRKHKRWLSTEEAEALWLKHREGEHQAQILDRQGQFQEAEDLRKTSCFALNRQMIYDAPRPCTCEAGLKRSAKSKLDPPPETATDRDSLPF